jgi:hypothetical protein
MWTALQPAIHRVLAAQHDYIGHLNTEIQELRIVTERRIRELEITKQSVKDHAAVFSVVRRVPAEIFARSPCMAVTHAAD